MTRLLNQNEKANNILFVLSYVFLVLLILGIGYFSGIFGVVLFLFMYFAPIVFGFFSKNSIKSFLFGFLLLPAMEIFDFIISSMIDSNFAGGLDFLFAPKTLLFSVVWGFSGYFAAKKGNDQVQKLIYAACVFVILLLEFVLTFKTY
ncbi:hypothetical protein [Methanolapillus ohkumae]|uniref:Uncharacterized protein n=1 Tax=Methanolapillus ohkumae TaxID=3028298 RepID=A0AA96ZXD8_9EURY|nr:hypothetical protein MsAm2_13930 [Methanosarcinaceae archaeon Am2]